MFLCSLIVIENPSGRIYDGATHTKVLLKIYDEVTNMKVLC
jgi:hypothetical protein